MISRKLCPTTMKQYLYARTYMCQCVTSVDLVPRLLQTCRSWCSLWRGVWALASSTPYSLCWHRSSVPMVTQTCVNWNITQRCSSSAVDFLHLRIPLSNLPPPPHPQEQSGLWGALMIFSGLVGATIAGIIIDRTKMFKEVAVVAISLATICLTWFAEVRVQTVNLLVHMNSLAFTSSPSSSSSSSPPPPSSSSSSSSPSSPSSPPPQGVTAAQSACQCSPVSVPVWLLCPAPHPRLHGAGRGDHLPRCRSDQLGPALECCVRDSLGGGGGGGGGIGERVSLSAIEDTF